MADMLLVDVHAHLDMEGYEEYGGVDKVIEESISNGVKTIIANGVDIESNRKVLKLAKKFHVVKAALGVYPTHCLEMIQAGHQEKFDNEISFIESCIKNHSCVAIGEVGLEYQEIVDISDMKKNIQKDCLIKFISLARAYDIPIIVHSRGAEEDVITLLENEGMKFKKVIMHCFSGRKSLIQRIRENGWSFSIPCNLSRSIHFQQIVKDTPIEKILTETDSPYLSPERGKVNRPDNVLHTIKKIAEIKGLHEIEVSNMIYRNYQLLF